MISDGIHRRLAVTSTNVFESCVLEDEAENDTQYEVTLDFQTTAAQQSLVGS